MQQLAELLPRAPGDKRSNCNPVVLLSMIPTTFLTLNALPLVPQSRDSESMEISPWPVLALVRFDRDTVRSY